MLTADLAISWQRGGRTGPRYIKTEDAEYLREAEDLIEVFAEHEGRTRAELEQVLQEYVGVGTDYKIMRGLIKLLMDRSEFETASATEPAEIRRALFFKSREFHPLTNDEEKRAQVINQTALEIGCAPEAVIEGLYADLPLNQKLAAFEMLTAEELVDQYNLAQAQALLYRCVQMRLQVEPQEPGGYRELFGAIKAYRLIHTVTGSAASGYEILLDGPVSMFHRSQKYGVQMAVFLPALLACKGWQMRAEVSSKMRGSAFFELNSRQTQLRSPHFGEKGYENPSIEKLQANWPRIESEWSLEPSSEVITLGESAFIPDFVFKNPSGKKVYLEILGFWTPRYLKGRLQALERYDFRDFIIAAWDDLRGSREPAPRFPENVIVYKRSLDPAVVELVLNSL